MDLDDAVSDSSGGAHISEAQARAAAINAPSVGAEVRPLPRKWELSTQAPVIGAVRPLPEPSLARQLRFRLSNVELDGVSTENFDVAAASLSGSGHTIHGGSRQDSYNFAVGASGEMLLAVADGLGSSVASQVGSRLFCDSIITIAADHVITTVDDLNDLITRASERTQRIAESGHGLSVQDISCVCVVGLVRPECTLVARIGDASAFLLNEDEFAEVFVDSGSFLNVVAASFPGHVASDVEVVFLEGAPGILALVTDGLANDIRASGTVREWLQERWHAPIGAFTMGDSLRYRRQGSFDDRTAVVVWPRLQSAQGE